MITQKLQLQLGLRLGLQIGLLAALFVAAVLAFAWAPHAHAQALTWTANQTIDFSDPDIDLTVLSGSEATTMVVNTGTMTVVVPQNDVFTITSANRSLAATGVTTAAVSDTCVAGVARMTITGGTGGETITVTPGASACNAGGTSSGGAGGGGGSSGGSSPTTPTTPVAPSTPSAPSGTPGAIAPSGAIGAQISALATQLKSLIAALEAQGGSVSVAIKAQVDALIAVTPAAGKASFSSNLDVGASGADVSSLQNWLIKKGYSIPAGATGFYGGQTKAAVAAYQAANGISPAVGYFGPKTRAHVQANP